jgi:hypothetical protein
VTAGWPRSDPGGPPSAATTSASSKDAHLTTTVRVPPFVFIQFPDKMSRKAASRGGGRRLDLQSSISPGSVIFLLSSRVAGAFPLHRIDNSADHQDCEDDRPQKTKAVRKLGDVGDMVPLKTKAAQIGTWLGSDLSCMARSCPKPSQPILVDSFELRIPNSLAFALSPNFSHRSVVFTTRSSQVLQHIQ